MKGQIIQYGGELLIIIVLMTVSFLIFKGITDKHSWKDEQFRESVFDFAFVGIIIFLIFYFQSSGKEEKFTINELKEMNNQTEVINKRVGH